MAQVAEDSWVRSEDDVWEASQGPGRLRPKAIDMEWEMELHLSRPKGMRRIETWDVGANATVLS